MQQLNNLTNDANQLMTFTLTDGSDLKLVFIYRPAIQRWSLNVSHALLTLNGVNLCLGPNILRQWRNIVPFGLAVLSKDGLDPVDISDFQTGRITVYVLTPEEVQQVENEVLVNPLSDDDE